MTTPAILWWRPRPPARCPRSRLWPGWPWATTERPEPGDQDPSMRNNISAARDIAEARTAAYSSALWADVALTEGTDGPYATFPEIVRAAIVGRRAALAPLRG